METTTPFFKLYRIKHAFSVQYFRPYGCQIPFYPEWFYPINITRFRFDLTVFYVKSLLNMVDTDNFVKFIMYRKFKRFRISSKYFMQFYVLSAFYVIVLKLFPEYVHRVYQYELRR